MSLDDSDLSPIRNYNADRNGSSENDVKEFRKKLRNRQSAQRARDRQKARMRWLEKEVTILTVRNQALESENAALKSLLGDGVRDTLWRGRVGDVKPRKGILEHKSEAARYGSCPGNSHDFPVINFARNGSCQPKTGRNHPRTNHYSQSGSGERVAVISPMARVDNRSVGRSENVTNNNKLPHCDVPDDELEKKSHKLTEAKDDATTAINLNQGIAEQAILANGANLQPGFPISGSALAANYYTLLSNRYLAPFLQKVAFVNSFPEVQLENGKNADKDETPKKTVNPSDMVNALNFPSLAQATNPYFLLPTHPYSTLDQPGSIPIGILPATDRVNNRRRSAASVDDGILIKRHKMNSVESESSESDMIPSQC